MPVEAWGPPNGAQARHHQPAGRHLRGYPPVTKVLVEATGQGGGGSQAQQPQAWTLALHAPL